MVDTWVTDILFLLAFMEFKNKGDLYWRNYNTTLPEHMNYYNQFRDEPTN